MRQLLSFAAALTIVLSTVSPTQAQGVVALLLGDYNGDGAVSGPDYTVWRDTLDSFVNLAADGDFSGQVDPDDYEVWRQN